MLRNLFEFNVTRPFPYGRLWNLLTLIFSALVFVFVVIYATATAGYETVTRSSPNYNLRLTGWHTIFITKKTGICDTRLLTIGDEVYTTDGVIPWTIMTWRNRATGDFRWSVDYAAEKLESCTLYKLVMEPNMQTEISTIIASLNCTVGPYEVTLGADISFPANVQVAEARMASVGFTPDKQVAVNWNALFDLSMAWDSLLNLYGAAQNQPNYRLSTSVASNGTDFCGHQIVSDDLSKCQRRFVEPTTYTRWSAIDSDPTDRYNQGILAQMNAPFVNLAVWVIQLAYWDLGLASTDNLIRNYAGRQQYLQRCTNCPMIDMLLDRQPGGLWFSDTVLPLTDPGFTPPSDQSFNIQYLCKVRQLKQPANLIQSVLVATFSLFGAYWAFYRTVWVLWGTHFGEERHKRVFNGEPETPTPTSTLGYGPVKPGSPSPGAYGQPATYPQQQGYFGPQKV
ncbi:hypothetical protein CC85DRAFT_283923 [Cutaneotrichosporon oleaginosum]|uniref:Uncharacterized protein n=1 Tax=Cutaneotrichosporon oleaginosum TaxID=879819 RepID=A0A0J0XSQ5_9TREE|nr:uncharacterized protein CC85DRAFT_283923 [Cutaneotrichosporon oleaginosum]KLT44136.1 hypothetical protein CC85DRAFT_283923 [Cutaneotrichosporon oleaginosum]